MKTTNGSTTNTNAAKQRKLVMMGKFTCFVHRWLMPVAGLLFVIMGLAKVASVFGEAELLGKPDPVFGFV